MTQRFEKEATPRIADPARFLIDAFIDAHIAVKTLGLNQQRPPNTTCVACVVQDGRVWWAHAGDSRFYLLRDGELVARTRDHSYVEELLRYGLISADEFLAHPQRNLVLSCLGAADDPRVDRDTRELMAGDTLLLCSDGVWESLTERALVKGLGSGDIALAAPLMLDLAASNAGDNSDNLTLLAVRWEGDEDGPVTIAKFADTVFDISHGTSPHLLSDDAIERAIADIRTRIEPLQEKT